MRFLYATALETATWGLVAATALLFLASAIPAIGAIFDRHRKRAERVAALIPDLHIIRTRINGAIDHHANSNPDDEELKSWAENIGEILGMIKPLFKPGRREGLKFTNELYICRHLLTQAYYEYLHARQAERFESNGQAIQGTALVCSNQDDPGRCRGSIAIQVEDHRWGEVLGSVQSPVFRA